MQTSSGQCLRPCRLAKLWERYSVYWLEEPTHPDDVQGHRVIADGIEVPLALGESLRGKEESSELFGSSGGAFSRAGLDQCGWNHGMDEGRGPCSGT